MIDNPCAEFFEKTMDKQTFKDQLTEVRVTPTEETCLIDRYLEQLGVSKPGHCVDIAASEGVLRSNTLQFFIRNWSGLAVECCVDSFSILALNYRDFPQVNLARCKVAPHNVGNLLRGNEVPKDFDFLSLDIDSYDYYILEAILQEFRPKLVFAEINETIPPPVKFTVKWDPGFTWAQNHFFGQSLSQMASLANEHNYSLAQVLYNNAILIPSEICPVPNRDPSEAYMAGYVNKPDRHQKHPWNDIHEEALSLDPQETLEYVNRIFSEYKGQYIASL